MHMEWNLHPMMTISFQSCMDSYQMSIKITLSIHPQVSNNSGTTDRNFLEFGNEKKNIRPQNLFRIKQTNECLHNKGQIAAHFFLNLF